MKEDIGGWDYFRYWFYFLIGCCFACKSTDSLPDGQVSHSFFLSISNTIFQRTLVPLRGGSGEGCRVPEIELWRCQC